MALNFPATPTEGQIFAAPSGPNYVYHAPVWDIVPEEGGGSSTVAWSDITDKPSTFPPTLPIAWSDISGAPATFPPTLPIAQSGVTNLVSDLALKAPIDAPLFTGNARSTTPPTADNDTSIATTAHVQANMALKANVSHTHAQSDVTSLVSDLALKAPIASPTFTGQLFAPAGAVGAPGLSFSGVPDMGIFATAAMNFAVGGVQKLQITSSLVQAIGNVKLVSTASTTTRSGFIVTPGTKPTTPTDGDIWATAAGGFYGQHAGVSKNLSIHVGTTAPASPITNDLWLDIN